MVGSGSDKKGENMIFKLFGVIAAMIFSAAVNAQTKWDMPTPYSDGEFHTINVRQFAEDVKKATGGRLEIVVHSNGSLIKHPDMLRAVSTGQVNIVEFLLGQFGNEDPMFAADNIPFVATGYDNAYRFYQAQKPFLEKKLAARGMRLLYSVAWPGQGLYTKNPLKSVDDLKGTKMRTYSPQTARLAELLGASPTVIQVPEVPQAFATGTVHAMITSSATGTSTKAWEFVKNYYMTAAFHPKNVVVVNERAFQRLPDAEKKALLDAAAAAEKRGWDLSRQREQNANKELAQHGMNVLQPDAAMKAAFLRIGETMLAEWQKTAGAEGEALSKAYRSK
jgi:TRAP-type transport system periplasmic protein